MKTLIAFLALTLAALAQELPPKPTPPADVYVIIVDRTQLSGAQQTALANFVSNNGSALMAAAVPAGGVEVLNNWAWRHGITQAQGKNVHKLLLTILRDTLLQMTKVAPADLPQAIKDLDTAAATAAAAAEAARQSAAGSAP